MIMTTAAILFKASFYGICPALSAYPVSSTVFRNSEKLSCANEVSASKQVNIRLRSHCDSTPRQEQALNNKGLLLSDRSLSGRDFHSFSNFQDIDSLCLEKLYQSNFTAAKSSNGLSRLFLCFNPLQVERQLITRKEEQK